MPENQRAIDILRIQFDKQPRPLDWVGLLCEKFQTLEHQRTGRSHNLVQKGRFPRCTTRENHISARGQEHLLTSACREDARVALLESVHVGITLHVAREGAANHPPQEGGQANQSQVRAPLQPEDQWHQLDQFDLENVFSLRVPTLKSCPHFLSHSQRIGGGEISLGRRRTSVRVFGRHLCPLQPRTTTI